MKVLFFMYGLFIGSFLNVCAYRIPESKSVIYPHSSCVSCGHVLNFIDMLPVVSYICYKGRCKYCKTHYSAGYPIIEFLNGSLYFLVVLKYGLSFYSVILCLLISILIVVCLIDLKYMIIPNIVNIATSSIGMLLLLYERASIADKILGSFLGFGLFILISLFTGAMGGGDIKLMAVIGLVFGIKGVLFITLFSFIIGAVISILLICLKIKNRKDKIPFGPFISLAELLYIFYGEELIIIYYNLLYLNY